MITIKHDAWYATTTCIGTQRVLVYNNHVKRLEWTDVEDLYHSHSQELVIPSKWKDFPDGGGDEVKSMDKITNLINANKANTSPMYAYEMGFLVGAFMRVGGLRNFPEMTFTLYNPMGLENTIAKCGMSIFNAASTKHTIDHTTIIVFYDKYMWNVFSSYGVYEEREIPDVLIQGWDSADFASGFYDGLVKTGSGGVPRISDEMYHKLYWASLHSSRSMCHGQFSMRIRGCKYQMCFGRRFLSDRTFNTSIFYLKLEDEEDVEDGRTDCDTDQKDQKDQLKKKEEEEEDKIGMSYNNNNKNNNNNNNSLEMMTTTTTTTNNTFIANNLIFEA
jgi:hypothetical protein